MVSLNQTSTIQRADIQALRALAVGVVIVNHIWPSRLTGGYVGVDVFFVISGFLITTHLLKELQGGGRIRLIRFYARRMRRLLPAALLVLAVSAVLVWRFLPYPRWEREGQEILSSAFYVENWFLAARSVNYSALNDAASVAQHYWSLSVEEQFYLVWPLLLWGVWKMTRGRVKMQVIGIALVIVVSLSGCVWYTMADPAPAYFVTPARFWEFGLGGLLALLGLTSAKHRLISQPTQVIWQILAIAGFGLIAWSAMTYSHVTAFPGWAALVPAVGTALVIHGGTVVTDTWHGVITSFKPIQYAGDISYSLYLWHWPLICLAPFVLERTPERWDKVAIFALSVVLAGLCKRFVEDPGRRWNWLQVRNRRQSIGEPGTQLTMRTFHTGGIASASDIRRLRRKRRWTIC